MIVFSSDPQIADQQMYAIIFYLVTFGYVDGDFDLTERLYVKDYIRKLVTWQVGVRKGDDPTLEAEHIERAYRRTIEVFEGIDHYIKELFNEAVANDEGIGDYVVTKLKVRCFEIFKRLDECNQKQLLKDVDDLIAADGVIHPAEVLFRDELFTLLKTEVPLSLEEIRPIKEHTFELSQPVRVLARAHNHPLFTPLEEHYSKDQRRLLEQAEFDARLIRDTLELLASQRSRGKGLLTGKQSVGELEGEREGLDGHIWFIPPKAGKSYEIFVLGDLHGCYSCLKAALMQSDFVRKVEAYRADPQRNPEVKLVFLGDYIDRGYYSYNGVMRAVLQIFKSWPEHVFMLRGNHEFYVERKGKILSGVMPAEAIDTMTPFLPQQFFKFYMALFEALPNMLLFGRTVFVHAGIPRDDMLEEGWAGLSSLNQPRVRFQMLWSDPSQAPFIPADLQKKNARFSFGRLQFRRFMSMIGANTMLRGHEKVNEGFKEVFDEGGIRMFTLFSAGGAHNSDLPERSSYRGVNPMAMTISYRDGVQKATPWPIEYQRYIKPVYNQLYDTPPEFEFRRR